MAIYRLGLYEKSMPNTLSVHDKLCVTGECGFDFLELSVDETEEKLARLDWSAEERSALRRAQERSGVPIRSMCLSGHRKFPLGHPDPAIREKSLQISEKAIGLAADLGIRIIQLAGYDVYYSESTDQTRRYFGENLARSVEMAAREGVILAFETMETDFMNTVTKAMEWVNAIGSPYLQIYPDIGNVTNACHGDAVSVCADLAAGRGHLAALHLKESRQGVYRELPYGEGWVDFEAACRTAMELKLRRYLAEFWYLGQDTWREDIRNNGEFLRRFLDAAAMNDLKGETI